MIAYYRNYDVEPELIFSSSSFESKPEYLINFLNEVGPYGGWGN